MPCQTITADLQIRKLSYKTLRELSDLLDINGPTDWRALIAELPPNQSYSRGQIAHFEREGFRPGCSSSLSLLTDLGHQLMTVGELASYLERINHQEALLLIKPHVHIFGKHENPIKRSVVNDLLEQLGQNKEIYYYKPVFIIHQPSSKIVQYGQNVELRCEASGFPRPRYQWYKYQSPLRHQCSPVLKFEKVKEDVSGDYYCAVTNPVGTEYTDVVSIQITPLVAEIVDGITGPEDLSALKTTCIQNNIEEQLVVMYVGQYFELTCNLDAQHYQWYKNGYEIVNACEQKLVFNEFQKADEGHYSCKINCNGKEIITRLANLKVSDETAFSQKGNSNFKNQEFANAKLALVIANEKYQYPRNNNEVLVHPVDDAKLLSATLQKIGFKVTCLVNLNKREMEAAIEGFCKLLRCANGVYSLFYFCGHGFEEHGKTYLVPTDAANEWHSDIALSAEYVLSKIQHCKTTKLDVLLLDVCRIRATNDSMQSEMRTFDPPFLPGAQCVFGYATCPQSQAFEKRRDTNGIYMKHLSHYITENMQIETVLHKVGKAVREETESHHITNTMSPTFKSTTTRVFSLLDNVLPVGFVEGELDPNIFWFDYHRLPPCQRIHFEHNIVVEMRFLPVCSNICNVVIHVESMGDTTCGDAKVIEVCEEVDVPLYSMNQEFAGLPEFLSKSLQFNSNASSALSDRPSEIKRWTQISALQKLTGPFSITVVTEYIPHGSRNGERLQEVQRSYREVVLQNSEFGIVSFFNV